jgi:hypothetical protein
MLTKWGSAKSRTLRAYVGGGFPDWSAWFETLRTERYRGPSTALRMTRVLEDDTRVTPGNSEGPIADRAFPVSASFSERLEVFPNQLLQPGSIAATT